MTDTAKQVQEYAAHSFHTWSRQKGWKAPLLVNDAEGIYFYDQHGQGLHRLLLPAHVLQPRPQEQGGDRGHRQAG